VEENDVKVYEVIISDEANSEVNRLARKKKFVSLPRQIISLVDDIEKGILNGDIVLSYAKPTKIDVYKVRLPNPDTNVGKSNGYRVLYAMVFEQKLAVILSVYYKKEITNIPGHVIREYVDELIAEYLYGDSEDD
jgi:mRNA-degrading endonuclease RelE of RelBE toxin-antitoxin system